MRWAWFTLALIWPFDTPKHRGHYPAYLSKYYGQLWVARAPREYSLRQAQLGAEPVHAITHATYLRQLVIYDPALKSWEVRSEPDIIKQQKYVAISYRYEDIIPEGTPEGDEPHLKARFITQVEAVMASLDQAAYWTDLMLIDKKNGHLREEVDKDVFCMADVYRGAEFMLIMLCPFSEVTEDVTEEIMK